MSNLLANAAWANIEQLQLDADDREAAQSTVAAIFAICDKHGADSRAVKGDPHLNETGKKAGLTSLIDAADRKIDAITKQPLAALEARSARLQATIDNQSSAKPTPEETMLHIEARGHLDAMDPLNRNVLLEELALNGRDDRTLTAALNASAAKPLVKPELATKLKGMIASRQFPDIADQLKKTNATRGQLLNSIATAKHAIATEHERRHMGAAQVQTSSDNAADEAA